MKNTLYALLVFMMVGCSKEETRLTFSNPTDESLFKSLTISREALSAKELDYLILKDKNGEVIPVQFDDLDGDGVWDEVAFQYALESGEEVSLTVESVSDTELPDFTSKANAYLGYSPERNNEFTSVTSNERPAGHEALSTPYLYQYEGPGWESELVAFRTYFDSRNGKDIFGKTKPDLKLETIGLGENYHELQDWGLDILKVGNSLGAGALGLLKNDSVYRLGDTETASFEIISDGPVRAITRLIYTGWNVAGTAYELEETISIWAGTRYYQSEVALKPENASEGADTLVTGIVNLKDLPAEKLASGGTQAIYTHGVQSENNDALGMALIINDENLAGFGEAPEKGTGVTNTYLAYLVPDDGIYRFHFLAGWEGERSDFADEDSFRKEILKSINDINQGVELKTEK